MRAQTILAKEVVGKKEEEGVCYRLSCIFYHARIKAGQSALLGIDLASSIADVFVFSFVRGSRILAKLTLDLEACDYEVERIGTDVGNSSTSRSCKSVS